MGSPTKDRRAVQVDESTWRKARVLAAAFGLPVYAIVTRAINEMATKYAAEVSIQMREEVKDEQVPRKGASRGSRTRG
jgi:hypothetical protein